MHTQAKQWFSLPQLTAKVAHVLARGGLSQAQAQATAYAIACAEQDQCFSHGLYRIVGLLKTAASDIANGQSVPTIDNPSDKAIIKVNAHDGFSSLAFNTGLPLLVAKAKQFGIAAMAINQCIHYTALWLEVEQLAQAGLAGLAMCPTAAYVAPYGGNAKLLGTNPLAFAWPCTEHESYVFDFATSAAARGEIELCQLRQQPIPNSWAIDANGQPTTDAAAGLAGALLPFGEHKGSALATMIELLAGVWIDDLLSSESSILDQARLLAPKHGELIFALDPTVFGARALTTHTQHLLEAIVAQGARLPSQRRFAARRQAQQHGISVDHSMVKQLDDLAIYGIIN